MSSFLSKALIASVAITAISISTAHAAMPGGLANATRYDVDVKQVDVCTAASSCVTIGAKSQTFNIASVAAGAQIGSYIDIRGITPGQTFTSVRVRVGPSFVVVGTGLDDQGNTCSTTSTPGTASGHTTLGSATAGAAPTAQTLFVPNLGSLPGGNPTQADFDSFNVSKVNNEDVTILFPLTSAYTSKNGLMPTVTVKFNTQSTIRFVDIDGPGGGTCGGVYVGPPSVTITVTD